MRESERLAVEWCEDHGVDPLEFVPFRVELADGRSEIHEVPRYLAISGGVIKRPGTNRNGVPVH